MKKVLLFILVISLGLSVDAQCLGEDCSIKGRNKARSSKSKKMTGKRSRRGSQYSVSGGKRSKRKRGSSKGFDPFASSGKKGGGAGGYDPFSDYDKKNKRKNKKGSAYDPFGKKSKSKYKGRASAGGYDPFDSKKGKRKGRGSGGYDPFEDKSNSRRRSKTKGGTWTARDGKKNLKVKYKSAYSNWDGSSKRGKKRGGRANDSWLAGAGGGSKVKKGGGIWNSRSSKKRRGLKGGTDNWSQGHGKKSVSSGGGLWYSAGQKGSGRANKYESGRGNNNNWDKQTTASTTAPPRYERIDNTPKSYSDYENVSMSGDLIYDRPYQYKYSLIAGTIKQHTSEVEQYLSNTTLRPILGAEFGVEWPTVGSKNYHHYYNIPTVGLGFTYLNLGNEAKLGSAFAIYPYADMPLLRTDPVDINFTAGFGLAGVTKWNKQSPSNLIGTPESENMPMFSSPLNVYVKTGLNIAYRPFINITNQKLDNLSHYTYSLGVYYTHMSNGSFASPNHGLNMLTTELSMKYTPPVITPVVRKPGERLPRYLYVDIMGSAFIKEFDRMDTKKYLVGNVNIALYYQAANVYRIGIGVDGFYDESFTDNHAGHPYSDVYKDYLTTDRFSPNVFEHRIRGGACLSNEFVFGRTTAVVDGGYYVYDNIKPDYNYEYDFLEKTYLRFAMKYRLTTNLFGVVAFKTHMLQAEYVTFGLGYSILL